jgi:hypothetical protein
MSSPRTPRNSYGDDGTFWRTKLAESLGLDPSVDDVTLGIAQRKNNAWRNLHAQAIGANPNLSESALLAAHEKHMADINKRGSSSTDETPSRQAAVAKSAKDATLENEQRRRHQVQELVAQKKMQLRTDNYDLAFNAVRMERPDLFAAMAQPSASNE